MSAKSLCVAAETLTTLSLNLKKTVSTCVSMRRKAKDKLTIKINQEEIKEASDFKFLGVILDSPLKFDKHIKKKKKQDIKDKSVLFSNDKTSHIP